MTEAACKGTGYAMKLMKGMLSGIHLNNTGMTDDGLAYIMSGCILNKGIKFLKLEN